MAIVSRKKVAVTTTTKAATGAFWSGIFTLHALSIEAVVLLVIAFISLLHVGALLLFTGGFLLTRTTLEKRNLCELQSSDCTLPAKYDRVIIVLIDALRYDFLFPVSLSSPTYDASHHNHLTVPIRLSQISPTHSLLYKGVADPPTTTLQRLKAITTGSLPTFIDAGSNFAGSAVEEDNWLEQANRAGKRIAFTGDDTWLTVFPESIFAPNRSFPFDSFNVEDLDTVDHGVNLYVRELMEEANSTWDILLAHPLGLDHAGHRFGASHGETTRKLSEMNVLLEMIVDRMREKDLLVVLGDHGMDAKGNHGGDAPDETDAGLWLYSRTQLVPPSALSSEPFARGTATLEDLLDHASPNGQSDEFFDQDGVRRRSLPQISLVPTLSLLLGFPIPINNLGSIIPELFLEVLPNSWLSTANTGTKLLQASRINSIQIGEYLQEYTSHSSGSDLAPFAPELLELYEKAKNTHDQQEAFLLHRNFTYTTLQKTRSIWARFSPILMTAGLVTLVGSLMVLIRLYLLSRNNGSLWKTGNTRLALSRGLIGLAIGTAIGSFLSIAQILFDIYIMEGLQEITFFACATAELAVITFRSPRRQDTSAPNMLLSSDATWLGIAILVLHSAIFASNSYTMWEDSIVLFMIQVPPLWLAAQAFLAPNKRLRNRIAGFSVLFMAINRLIGFSTVCREEQHPYCTATFYGSSGTSVASPSAIIASTNLAISFPNIVGIYLDISKSRQGWAPLLLRYSFRGLYTGGALYWGADYLEHAGAKEYTLAYQTFKITVARVILPCSVLLATTVWFSSPLCIAVVQKEITDQTGNTNTQVTVTGFANSIGSSYLLLFLAVLGPIFLLAQPVGQIVLALGVTSLLSILEAFDSCRDAAFVRRQLIMATKPKEVVQSEVMLPATGPSFLSISTLVLLGFHLFFTTGHQAVLSSIQWKVAFVGFPTLTYPFSPILVLLNTLGPFILSAAAVPLLVFWNVAPSLKNGPTVPLLTHLLRASLAFLLYHTAITLSSAVFASHLRRHLMVWKVFAPRFMLSALTLITMDATFFVFSIGWGGIRTLQKVQKIFGTAWS
ncbi:MAG: mannose-ethanolamine phosphotransferase gpi13 [Cyphobasidiales sp. Tagirdzhanova-0007]|nr:MAG: mannose-ethanolamine phosphotransferase gpi13 [Cyphobasidiales sp. Tagirdzhanova-0007]